MKMIRFTQRDFLKPLLFSLLLAFTAGVANGQKVMFQEKVFYKSNRFELSAEGKKALLRIKDSLVLDSTCTIVVNGHADDDGDADYNLKLSEKRAAAVKQFLSGK